MMTGLSTAAISASPLKDENIFSIGFSHFTKHVTLTRIRHVKQIKMEEQE
jgi:hypothetical protein